MKKYLISLVVVLCATLCAFGQEKHHQSADAQATHNDTPVAGRFYNFSFLGKEKTPDAMAFLPGPPSENDPLYQHDLEMYEWGKSVRGTLRGDTAIWDARTDTRYLIQRFGWAINKDITPENCPNLAQLIRGAMQDIRGGMQKAKNTYARHRPYQVFSEHTPLQQDERDDDYTSYPSGHSVRAWALALIFVALDPEHENEIMKTGYDMCESRVILGFHFESDVEAARLVASAGFARLVAEPNFLAYLQLARDEIQKVDIFKE